MSFLEKRRQREQAASDRVSLAEQHPGARWDQETTELAAVGALLEPSYVPNEHARAKRKAALLDAMGLDDGEQRTECEVVRGAHARNVVIADIEQVSQEKADAVAERFAALMAEKSHQA